MTDELERSRRANAKRVGSFRIAFGAALGVACAIGTVVLVILITGLVLAIIAVVIQLATSRPRRECSPPKVTEARLGPLGWEEISDGHLLYVRREVLDGSPVRTPQCQPTRRELTYVKPTAYPVRSRLPTGLEEWWDTVGVEPPKQESKPKVEPPKPEYRQWTAETGESRVAEFVGYANGRVKLRDSAGKEGDILFERLSHTDQEYVKRRRLTRRK